MARKQSLDKELEKLLCLKATEEDISELKSKGIIHKNPTKMTLLAAALYEKALKGDLSAIREIFSRISPSGEQRGGVIFIDDIRNTP